jgi:hypothetical protein
MAQSRLKCGDDTAPVVQTKQVCSCGKNNPEEGPMKMLSVLAIVLFSLQASAANVFGFAEYLEVDGIEGSTVRLSSTLFGENHPIGSLTICSDISVSRLVILNTLGFAQATKSVVRLDLAVNQEAKCIMDAKIDFTTTIGR